MSSLTAQACFAQSITDILLATFATPQLCHLSLELAFLLLKKRSKALSIADFTPTS
jgi:hypothetical protein